MEQHSPAPKFLGQPGNTSPTVKESRSSDQSLPRHFFFSCCFCSHSSILSPETLLVPTPLHQHRASAGIHSMKSEICSCANGTVLGTELPERDFSLCAMEVNFLPGWTRWAFSLHCALCKLSVIEFASLLSPEKSNLEDHCFPQDFLSHAG